MNILGLILNWILNWMVSKSYAMFEWIIQICRPWRKQGIKEIEVCKKCSKENLYCYFWSNYVQTFFGWCIMTQIVCQFFSLLKKSNIGYIFSFVCETSWRAGRITMTFTPCLLHVMCNMHHQCISALQWWVVGWSVDGRWWSDGLADDF